LNDSAAEIRQMCTWVRKNLSADVPMHFTRFRAMYKIQNLPPTPVSTLEQCHKIARDCGIRYPYIGNMPGHQWGNTYCHKCGKIIIKRSGFYHVECLITKGLCPYCRTKIPGVWS
jgi:pyruvate formate lyase activating enzyme